MKILFSALKEFESPTASVIHVGELANSFVKLGHDVDLVILGSAKHFHLNKRVRLFNASVKKRNILQFIDGILLRYLWHCLKQAVWYLFQTKKRPAYYEFLLQYLVEKRSYDISYERFNSYNFSSILCSTKNIYTILEINGINEYEMRQRGIPEEIIQSLVKSEIELCKKVNLVVVVSNYIKEYFENKGIDEAKITVVFNGVNLELFRPLNKEHCRRKLDLESRPLIGFVGSFRPYEGLEFMIRAMPLIIESLPETKLVIVGSAWGMKPTREELVAEAEKIGVLDNIEFRDPVPIVISAMFINSFDVCFIFRHAVKRGGWSPIKLNNYLSCGKPVVCSTGKECDFIKKNNIGVSVEHTNLKETAEAFVKLLKDGSLSQKIGENARKYAVDNCSWDLAAEKILGVVE